MVAHDLLVCDQFTVQLAERADDPIRRAWRTVDPRLFTPRKTDFRRRGMLLLSSPLRVGQFRLTHTVFHQTRLTHQIQGQRRSKDTRTGHG
jgi:hypothetical protein